MVQFLATEYSAAPGTTYTLSYPTQRRMNWWMRLHLCCGYLYYTRWPSAYLSRIMYLSLDQYSTEFISPSRLAIHTKIFLVNFLNFSNMEFSTSWAKLVTTEYFTRTFWFLFHFTVLNMSYILLSYSIEEYRNNIVTDWSYKN